MAILAHLSSAQLTEVMYLFCRVLYDTMAQFLSMPHYTPGPYRNMDLTTTMYM